MLVTIGISLGLTNNGNDCLGFVALLVLFVLPGLDVLDSFSFDVLDSFPFGVLVSFVALAPFVG